MVPDLLLPVGSCPTCPVKLVIRDLLPAERAEPALIFVTGAAKRRTIGYWDLGRPVHLVEA